MAGVCVIVAYRPKPGKNAELLELVRSRVPTLAKEGHVTNRKPTIMRAADGTIIEVSEWVSREAIEAAHKNEFVRASGSRGNVRRLCASCLGRVSTSWKHRRRKRAFFTSTIIRIRG